jgi:hypothetical protein
MVPVFLMAPPGAPAAGGRNRPLRDCARGPVTGPANLSPRQAAGGPECVTAALRCSAPASGGPSGPGRAGAYNVHLGK